MWKFHIRFTPCSVHFCTPVIEKSFDECIRYCIEIECTHTCINTHHRSIAPPSKQSSNWFSDFEFLSTFVNTFHIKSNIHWENYLKFHIIGSNNFFLLSFFPPVRLTIVCHLFLLKYISVVSMQSAWNLLTFNQF